MKSLFVAFLLTFFSLFLSGCTSNASLENTQEYDSDDIDVIGTIWPQALDQMLLWLDVPVVEQAPVVVATPSYAPSVVSKQPVIQQPIVEEPVVQQPTIVPTTPSFVEDKREENHQEDREWDDD